MGIDRQIFFQLSKLPKEQKDTLPIFNSVLAIVENGKMTCMGFEEYYSKNEYKIKEIKIDGVFGSCEICVPRNIFVNVVQMFAEQGDFEINMDEKTMTMIVSNSETKSKIKGLDKDKFYYMI